MKKHEKKYIEVEGIMRACYDSFLKTGNKAYSEIIALADAVPAADVAEVVRCKDCKHSRSDEFEPLWCYVSETCDPVKEDHFCGYGERRDE